MGVKTQVRIDGTMVLIAAAVLGGVVVYSKWDAIKAGLNKVNPASAENVVYSGLSGAIDNTTKYQSVGDWVYETRKYNPIAYGNEFLLWLMGEPGAM